MALIDNLVSYWSLDEASGTRVDSHGSNDLADNGGVTGTSGVATFDGSNDYLNVASNASLQMGDIDFSIVYFFRASTVSNPRGHVAKVSAASGATWEYYIRTNGTTLEFNVGNGSTVGTATTTIANNTWYFVVAVHDSVNNELRLYLDGTLVSTVAWTTGALVGGGAFALGARPATSYAHFFGGDLDEVGIWKRALTTGEITDLYNGGDGRNYAYIAASGGGDENISVTDAGAASDAIALAVSLSVADEGEGADDTGVTVALNVADTGDGMDLVSVLSALFVSIGDSGVGADSVNVTVGAGGLIRITFSAKLGGITLTAKQASIALMSKEPGITFTGES